MVGARQPHGRVALHAVVADHQVFHGDKEGVAQVQLAGDVGRRDGDDIGRAGGVKTGLARVIGRGKIAAFFPPAVQALFGCGEIIGFW